MQFDGLTRYLTGVLVPVSALRSDTNLGVGEFADLPDLAEWCRTAGLDLIQLLPVNDSGGESSPYSALSAFALHPLYLRITDLPELNLLSAADRARILDSCASVRREHDREKRLRYRPLLDAKLAIMREVFSMTAIDQTLRTDLDRFVSENRWILPYAAFKVLKANNEERSWKEWTDHRDPNPEEIASIWADEELSSDLNFHVWVQMRLEQQFALAAEESAARGVMLKGDLPILMNEDSADVWAHRDLFVTRLRAGAPPDMFTSTGQNWGLPVYNWGQLARDNYQWWKDRLTQAAKFYSAYRIDHVLGFFRVWAIPEDNFSGLLGHFVPSVAATVERLNEIGYDEGRIRWLAEPHLSGEAIKAAMGSEASSIIELAFEQVGDEDLYLFRSAIHGERDLLDLAVSEKAREWLIAQYSDRALIALEDASYAPAWSFRGCSRYTQIQDDEKQRFETLVRNLGIESEQIWEKQARELLGFMREASGMLVCAEDLGVIPAAVPRVLTDIGMLGLRIPRWARSWNEPGEPYIRLADYPFLTVCAPSVHDTSTMRGWWEEEPDKAPFWDALGLDGRVPESYDESTARLVIEAILDTGSSICVFQLQDLLALSPGYTPVSAEEERVNIPGTVNDINWSYRFPVGVTELANSSEIAGILRPLLEKRRSRPVDGS